VPAVEDERAERRTQDGVRRGGAGEEAVFAGEICMTSASANVSTTASETPDDAAPMTAETPWPTRSVAVEFATE
jgi:hypothetical protein